MLKLLLTVVLILCILYAFCGCNFLDDNNDDEPYWVTDDPIPYYECGFMEKVTYGDKYVTATSFKISSSYDTGDILTDGSGYFVIIGVDTNMSKDDFDNGYYSGAIYIPQGASLEFVLFDEKNGKLVYEIQKKDFFDYSRLENLKISDSTESDLYVLLHIPAFVYHHKINDREYCGKLFLFNLELPN